MMTRRAESRENERELLEVIRNNNRLKSELSALHLNYVDMVEERDRLQLLVDRFDECHVRGGQITNLQRELSDAHNHKTELEGAAHNTTALRNQSLYEELVATDMGTVITGLSKLLKFNSDTNVVPCSSNKLKKYIKVNRYIRKTQKLLKIHKSKTKTKK
ncbi:jg12444 [Pararge aegeria aegeria]|uniref:Jg12444 protein n=1 Tax=Pararge aegeria aegeria TaxID=348720 RepID=A0A8S4RPK4_9NEOP|nr:jg12444 [Pararge aegeria aegeria]